MKKFILYFFILLTLTTCNPDDNVEKYIPNENVVLSVFDSVMFTKINEYRINNGLNPVKLEKLATELATEHVEYMIQVDSMNHNYFYDRVIKSKAYYVGEIVAYNYITPESMLAGYISSPPHRSTLVNPNYTHVGINTRNRFNTCLFTGYK